MQSDYIVTFLEEADEDYFEAFSWYANIREDLGMDFEDEMENLLLRVKEFPSHFPLIYKGVQKAVVKRFPYVVFSKVFGDEIIVIAIQHNSRNSNRLKKRIDDNL